MLRFDQTTSIGFARTTVKRLRQIAAVLVVSTAFACSGDSQVPRNKKPAKPVPTMENKKMSAIFIGAIRQHDRTVLDRASQAPANLSAEIEKTIGELDDESRELAVEVIARQDSDSTGDFLLARTGDNDANVATLAADNLGKVINKPDTANILSVIPERKDPFIRGKLYLEAGKRSDGVVLEELRKQAANERDDEAKLRNLAARVKRGGRPERSDFLDIVRRTKPDDALDIQELLLYINDPNLARGLEPWLASHEDVMRLGSDRQNMMARMCDVGIFTAHLLKIHFPFDTSFLRNFTSDEIESARKILAALPE